jgi:hypothetical protein
MKLKESQAPLKNSYHFLGQVPNCSQINQGIVREWACLNRRNKVLKDLGGRPSPAT